jgi:hypothetical protein
MGKTVVFFYFTGSCTFQKGELHAYLHESEREKYINLEETMFKLLVHKNVTVLSAFDRKQTDNISYTGQFNFTSAHPETGKSLQYEGDRLS